MALALKDFGGKAALTAGARARCKRVKQTIAASRPTFVTSAGSGVRVKLEPDKAGAWSL